MNEKYGITDKGALNVLEDQSMNLIGREHLVNYIQTKEFLFSKKLF